MAGSINTLSIVTTIFLFAHLQHAAAQNQLPYTSEFNGARLSSRENATSRWLSAMMDGDDSEDSPDYCEPAKNLTQAEKCAYVEKYADVCEGGGYLMWTQYVDCEANTTSRIFIIIASVLYFLFLVIMISTAADDFFSPAVASVVAHLKISESVAGVTFMAFGNGAPDIFGSIASVLSTPKPKADLALGELLGGGTFVTTMVVSTIILTQPFQIDAFNTFRDLIFYLIALGWICFVFLFKSEVYIWEPLVYLGLYAVYVVTVIIGHKLHKKKKRERRMSSKTTRSLYSTAKSRNMTINRVNLSARNSVFSTVPEIHVISEAAARLEDYVDPTPNGTELAVNGTANGHPVGNGVGMPNGNMNKRPSRFSLFAHRLSVFAPNSIGREPDDLDNASSYSDSSDEIVVLHNRVYTGAEARSRAVSIAPPPVPVDSFNSLMTDVWHHLRPFGDDDEFSEAGILGKIHLVLKIIPSFLFKLTIPLNENSWSMAVAIIHAIFAPQWFLMAIQYWWFFPFDGSPPLFVYMFIPSAILIVLIVVFTKVATAPRYYKETYSYLGFLMSLSWIYFISNEVVNVVTMFGVVSGIPQKVIGLTILAWSNSIGDLIADVAVVKQGYPRMAMAAAIGGPLFNLLMGFGIPFTIAKAQGRTVMIEVNGTYYILMIFLGISLVTTLVGSIIQKGFLRRPHAAVLMSVYACFLVMVVLLNTGVINWD